MGQSGRLLMLLLVSITILSASSQKPLWESRQQSHFSGEAKNANITTMAKIHKRSICNLQGDSDNLRRAHFQQDVVVFPIQDFHPKTHMPNRSTTNNQGGKIIYQFQSEFQQFSKATLHYWSSSVPLVILVISFLLFFKKNGRTVAIKPKDHYLLVFFILCFLIKGSLSACNSNCQTCSVSTCSLCQQGYYKVGNTCPVFSTITGYSWANGLVCVGCVNGYYLTTSNICAPCSTPLPGCLRCVGPSVPACNQCSFGYALNSTSFECDSCPFYLTYCVTCLTRYSCTTCVNQTLTVNAAGNCQLCNVKKRGCYKCTSAVCLQCHNGYYLLPVSFCTPCNTTLPACVSCPSATVCIQCISNAYVLLNNSCIICGAIYPFCATCNSFQCLSCESSFFLNVYLKCECMRGILIDNVCVKVAGCEGAIKYQNNSYCTKCDLSIFYFNTTTVSCDCKSGFLLNDQCSLLYGCVAMYYVNSSQVCAMCNRTRHYTKNQTWCSCDRGFSLSPYESSCYEICGDGILFELQCDDGNNVDFDGCSHSCTIERGFKCLGGGENSSSKCLNALENFELEVEEIENMGQYDRGEFQFSILNFHPYFYILDLKKIFFLDIQQNHSISSLALRGSKVVFVVDYYQDLEGMPATLRLELIPEYFQYPKTVNITFPMVSSTAPLMLASYPSAAILEILSLILLGLSFLSLAILLFSPCYHKMIALETFTILQLCNLAPYLVNGDSVVLRVFDSLSYVNGFGRQLFQSATASEIYGETFQDMSLPKTFAQIMLINEGVLFTVAIFFVLAFWLRKFIFRFKVLKEKFRYFVNVYCCNLVFSVTMSLYLIFCLALTCNNHRVYEKTYKGRLYESTQSYKLINSPLNFSCIFVGQAMIVLVGFFNLLAYTVSEELLQKSNNVIIQLLSKQVKRLNVKSKSYVVVYLSNLFVCFSILAGLFFFDTKYKVYIYLVVSLPFAAYALIFRPYSSVSDNFGLCLGQVTSLIFLIGLCVKQYFWIVKVPITLFYEFYLCMVVIALLVVFVMTEVVRFFVACKLQRSRVEPIILKEAKKKKKYTRFRVENDDEALLVDYKKPMHRLDPLKCQEFNHMENPDLLRLKDKLRNDLFQKRNMYKNVNPFREISNPILETWLSDDGDPQ